MMTGNAALCCDEATNADGVWTVIVRSSHGVIGHIFRAVGEYGYFAGRFNAFTVAISDPSLGRLKARMGRSPMLLMSGGGDCCRRSTKIQWPQR
jgi:hypothetical protein